MAKSNTLVQKLVGTIALLGGVAIVLVPIADIGTIPLVLIGVYLLTRKKKVIG